MGESRYSHKGGKNGHLRLFYSQPRFCSFSAFLSLRVEGGFVWSLKWFFLPELDKNLSIARKLGHPSKRPCDHGYQYS